MFSITAQKYNQPAITSQTEEAEKKRPGLRAIAVFNMH